MILEVCRWLWLLQDGLSQNLVPTQTMAVVVGIAVGIAVEELMAVIILFKEYRYESRSAIWKESEEKW